MLFNLQVLRGVAALGVVFYHTDYRLPGDWHTEFFGVATFFVISGFIMCFITRDRADGFLRARIERIVPIYWVCTFALLFMMFRFALLNPMTWLNAPAWRPIEPLWSYVGGSLLFLPRDNPPILGVGWTLNFEMYFYLVFAGALMISRRFGPLLTAAFIYAVFQLDAAGYGGFLTHYYSHGYIHYFLAGIAVYYVWSFGSRFAPRWPTIVICVTLIAAAYGSQFARPWWETNVLPHLGWWGADGVPIVIVASVLFLESVGATVTWQPAVLIGDASYSIYLTHTILFEVMRLFREKWHLPAFNADAGAVLFYVLCATAVGVAVHLFVEKPLLRFVRTGIGHRLSTAAQH